MTASGAEAPTNRGMRLTLRDLEVLQALHTARYLTTPQIEKLFWRGGTVGRAKACQQRLRLLHQHGLVRRIALPIRRGDKPKPYVYALDRKGAELLVSELGIEPGQIDWRARTQEEHYPFLEHLLTTTDFRIALTQACEQSGVVLQEWEDEKELKSIHNVEYVTLHGPHGGSVRAALVPDAYFVLARDGQAGPLLLGGGSEDGDRRPVQVGTPRLDAPDPHLRRLFQERELPDQVRGSPDPGGDHHLWRSATQEPEEGDRGGLSSR